MNTSYENIYPTDFTLEKYQALYQYSLEQPENFWNEQALRYIHWFAPFKKSCTGDFENNNSDWFKEGKLNTCYNCLDRHLEKKDQIALIWQADDPTLFQMLTYQELWVKVCQLANILKNLNIKKGSRVCLYLPMIPELAIAMLACARIGAIHLVVFAGFSSESLKIRLLDAECDLIITADESIRGGKLTPLKAYVDKAIENSYTGKIIVVKRTGNTVAWDETRDLWYHELVSKVDAHCPVEIMDANDPLFILYTSGSTGKPKGVEHSTGGYSVYVATSFNYIFPCQEDDIFWCTADIGWITGHSYLIYGPLLNGTTTLLFEGVPHYPSFSRYWEIVDKFNVTIFYTSPTVIRALRHEGNKWLQNSSRKSLKLMGSVGEPISPTVWEWYYERIGNKKCPIVDTWWQTETGGILISSLPGVGALKPGSAGLPFFGIKPEILDEEGNIVKGDESGKLVITQPWPGLMKSIHNDHPRFINNYFYEFPGNYCTGDNAYRDKDNYYWIIGRNDDVIKVSGHRIGTGEIESILLSVSEVSEAAVVAIPHDVKGSSIFAFVLLHSDLNPYELKKKLNEKVRRMIGPIATLETIQIVTGLPKTRSGKIMRRLLRKIAVNEYDDLGDLSTLSDPTVITNLIQDREKNLV